MPEEVLFENESQKSRAAVAAYLHTLAENLESGESVTLRAGEEELTLNPPETVDFEVKAERETGSGPSELSIEVELEWTEGESAGDLEIE